MAGKRLSQLKQIFETLVCGEVLPDAVRDHSFDGTYRGNLKFRIEPDRLPIYRIDGKGLALITARTGSHSELLRQQGRVAGNAACVSMHAIMFVVLEGGCYEREGHNKRAE